MTKNQIFGITGLGLSSNLDFAKKFEACNRIEDFIIHKTIIGKPLKLGPKQNIAFVYAHTVRSLKSLDALLLLADAGYGEQALILSRTIFEDLVVSGWCASEDGNNLLRLFEEHEKAVAATVQDPDINRRYSQLLSSMPPLTKEELDELIHKEGVKIKKASGLWTGKGVLKMGAQLETIFKDNNLELFKTLTSYSYLLTSLVVHSSPAAVNTAFRRVEEQQIGYTIASRKPSTRLVDDALSLAYLSLSLLAHIIVLPEHEEELNILSQEDRRKFIVLNPRIRKITGRNDLCPCGSGLKFKRCHG